MLPNLFIHIPNIIVILMKKKGVNVEYNLPTEDVDEISYLEVGNPFSLFVRYIFSTDI